VSPIAGRARAALRAAGDRALSLTAGAASARFYGAALDLTPADDPVRPRLLLSLGEALHASGQEATPTLEDASRALVEAGEAGGAATAECLLAQRSWQQAGDRDLTDRHLDRAAQLIQGSPPTPAVARVLSELSRYHMLGGRPDEAITMGQEALSLAQRYGLDEVRASALDNIGSARTNYGYDEEGIEDLRQSIEIATAAHAVDESLRGYNNLGAVLMALGRLGEAMEVWRPGLELAERHRGLPSGEWLRQQHLSMAYANGRWDDLLRWRDEFLQDGTLGYNVGYIHETWGRVRLARGDVAGALRDAAEGLAAGRRAKDPQRMQPSLASAAFTMLAAGGLAECSELVDELLALDPLRVAVPHVLGPALDLAWIMTALGRAGEFVEAAAGGSPHSRWLEAGLAFARGRVEEAAEICARMGVVPCEAYARLLAGERLLADGKPEAAALQLHQALAFHRTVGASAYIRRAEALLAGCELPDAAPG
jgi:tetratricopeptide (TPR) repeat protein